MSFDDLYFHVILGCGNDAQFQDFCRLINQPQLAEIDEYKTNEDRVRNRTELISVSIDFLKFATNYIYRNFWQENVHLLFHYFFRLSLAY